MKKINRYQDLKDLIGFENLEGLKKTIKDFNRDYNLNILFDENEINSSINVYDYPSRTNVYIQTPSKSIVVITLKKS